MNIIGHRRSLYNDKNDTPPKSYNNYKYLYTQYWSTLIYKANTNKNYEEK